MVELNEFEVLTIRAIIYAYQHEYDKAAELGNTPGLQDYVMDLDNIKKLLEKLGIEDNDPNKFLGV